MIANLKYNKLNRMSFGCHTRCEVVYKYEGRRGDELSLEVGDLVEDVVRQDGGWATGRVGAKVGMFPLNHVTSLVVPSPRSRSYRALYSYKPTHEDEIELVAGTYIEVICKDESGWWQGRSMGRMGIFPSNFVEGPISEARPRKPSLVEDSPVMLRRCDSSRAKNVKSFHASIDQNIGSNGLSSKLFDPEDEPLGPMFGSLTSQFDWSTASLTSYKHKQGFFGRMKQSLSTKSLFPKFLSGRKSSNSLHERTSIGSFRKRRNSIASFFNKSSSKLPAPSPSGRLSFLPGYKECSTPVHKQQDARKLSLSDCLKSPEQSTGWVFQDSSHCKSQRFGSFEDSGVRDMDLEVEKGGEEIFGPIMEINDGVFEEMFEKKENQVKSDEENPSRSSGSRTFESSNSRLSLSKIRTSLSPFEKRFTLGAIRRNSIKTNPKVNWKPTDDNLKKIEVTEL